MKSRSILPLLLALIAACNALQAGEVAAFGVVEPHAAISALLRRADVRVALERVRDIEAQSLEDLVELTEIPAPPFGEARRAERFAALLREAGLADVSMDESGNVIGRRPGKSGDRVIAYTAHLDTVFPIDTDVTVRREGDRFIAPGVGDNTRGLTVILDVLRVMQHAGIETQADILFVGNVGEEGLGDLRGIKHLFREGGPQVDAMIAVDGGKTNRVVYGGVGSHRYRITFRGPGGHSWSAFGTASPHHALGRAIHRFVTTAPAVISSGDKTTFNVGRIGGGTSVNSVAFDSWMEVDLRSGNQGKLDEIDAVLQAAVQAALAAENAARTEGPELTVVVERIGTRPAARGDRESLLVNRASAALRAVGLEPDLEISSTDANYPISIGIPAITMSRGGVSTDSHALTESWQNESGHLAIQAGLLTLLAEAGIAP